MPAGIAPGLRLPGALRRSPRPPLARDLVGYVLPLLAIAGILGAQLVGRRPGPDAGLLLLLLVAAATGWLAGEGPALVALAASALAAAVLTQRPVAPLAADEPGNLLLFIATAVIITAVTVALRRRDVALRQSRERRLEETEAAREVAESRADRLARLQRLTEAVARQLEPAEMASRILALTIDDVRAAAGAIVSHDPGSDEVSVLASAGLDPATMSRWQSFGAGEGLPVSEAMRTGRPLVVRDAAGLGRRFPRLAAERPGSGSAIAIPLAYEDRIIGALYLRYRTVREVPDEELSFLLAVGAACAAALERSRLYAAERAARRDAERAAARLRFLVDASEVLAASLDLDATLHRLAAIAVPQVADWCAVRVVSPEGRLELAAVAHSDPSRLRIARELLASKPASLGDASGAGAVARTGRREVVADLADVLASGGMDPSVAEAIRDLELRTLVTVPLGTGSQTFGVLALAWSGNVHVVDEDEIALAEDLAGRAAMALDNARLHGDLEGHARRLQARTAEQAAVARLGQQALGGRELADLLDDALQTVRSLTGSDVAMLVRRLSVRQTCRVVAALGWDDGIVGTESPFDASDAGLAIWSGAAVRVDDLWREQRLQPSPEMVRQRIATGLAVPIAGADGPWGAVALHRRAGRPYDLDEEHFVGAVANVLAAALERARHERELAARDERLELTLATSRTGTWEWEAASGRIELSHEAGAMHGLGRATTLADLEAFIDLAHPDDQPALRQALARAIHDRGQFQIEYRIGPPDGSARWIHGVGRVFAERGVPQRLLGIVRDITERKTAEAEQEQRLAAEREARQVGRAFIGVISHELRTPITSIYAGSKLLQRSVAGESRPGQAETGPSRDGQSRREEIARDVEAEAERLYRLTEDLLVLTRLERGDLRIGGEPVLLGHVVRRVVASEQPRWPDVRFVVRERETAEPALGEEIYVEQVVRNLLSNAAKYSAPGSKVDVVIGPADGRVRVRVLDRGPGVGPDPAQLFELFYRAPQTASQASGAGIGLFVSRRLVEAMQGRLWARSRPGGGSQFGFDLERYDEDIALSALPIQPPRDEAMPPAPEEQPGAAFRAREIDPAMPAAGSSPTR